MCEYCVSIHAPVKDAIRSYSGLHQHSSFNSRTREGCDSDNKTYDCKVQVSIHAPVKGAMCMSYRQEYTDKFQFTHP